MQEMINNGYLVQETNYQGWETISFDRVASWEGKLFI